MLRFTQFFNGVRCPVILTSHKDANHEILTHLAREKTLGASCFVSASQLAEAVAEAQDFVNEVLEPEGISAQVESREPKEGQKSHLVFVRFGSPQAAGERQW